MYIKWNGTIENIYVTNTINNIREEIEDTRKETNETS
jgi:hypothetical protein